MRVLVGGLNTGKSAVARTARRLAEQKGEVIVPVTYSWSQRNHEPFRQMLEASDGVVSLSVGMIATVGAGVELTSLDAVGAPVPVSRARLFGRVLLKTADMVLRPTRGNRTFKETALYLGSSIAELSAHPISNMRGFFNGTFSHFNAFEHQDISAHTQLIYGTNDEFYGNEVAGLSSGNDYIVVEGARHDDVLMSSAYDPHIRLSE